MARLLREISSGMSNKAQCRLSRREGYGRKVIVIVISSGEADKISSARISLKDLFVCACILITSPDSIESTQQRLETWETDIRMSLSALPLPVSQSVSLSVC